MTLGVCFSLVIQSAAKNPLATATTGRDMGLLRLRDDRLPELKSESENMFRTTLLPPDPTANLPSGARGVIGST